MLIVKSQIIIQSLRASKPKGLNRIAKIAWSCLCLKKIDHEETMVYWYIDIIICVLFVGRGQSISCDNLLSNTIAILFAIK